MGEFSGNSDLLNLAGSVGGYFHFQFIPRPFHCEYRQKPSSSADLLYALSGVSIAIRALSRAER